MTQADCASCGQDKQRWKRLTDSNPTSLPWLRNSGQTAPRISLHLPSGMWWCWASTPATRLGVVNGTTAVIQDLDLPERAA
jgi:hypothetical protein